MHGRYFNFNPPPPEQDVLGNPLVVPKLPTHKLPKETWRSRFSRFLAHYHLGSQKSETRLRWKVYDTITAVMASVSPSDPSIASKSARRNGGRAGDATSIAKIRHPHQLKPAFEFTLNLPAHLANEAKFLELLLALILRKYGETMSGVQNHPFSFESEAKEYFNTAFKTERQLKNFNSPEERYAAIQNIYTNYYHGRLYYLYAVVRRERLREDSRLFSLLCRGAYFMARVEWNGELLDKPNTRMLPTRREILFHAQRDNAVLQHVKTDQEFSQQVQAMLKAFPE
ncbi:MAG: hypothetical protein GC191_00070 [Azospirillum sp.]|nr:hypothetical protein [Azospirillum sp.]